MTMYELTTEYTALLAEYDAAEDDARREEVMGMLDALSDDISDKGEAYARVLRNLGAEADALEAEAKRLTDRARAKKNEIQRVKDQLLSAMKRVGAKKLPTSIGNFTVKRNPWGAKIIDESKIPKAYRIQQPDMIDKAAIIRHFKATGEIIDGVEMRQDTSLQFR